MGFADFMQLAGVLVPIGGGFAWLAYKHPDAYARFASFLIYQLGTAIGIAYFCYWMGFIHGAQPKATILISPFFFLCWLIGFAFFLFLLTLMKAIGFSEVGLNAETDAPKDRPE